MQFTVSLSNPSAEEIKVTLDLTDGTATGGTDYTNTNIQVTIPAGSTSVNVNVPTTEDTADEDNETFKIGIVSVDAGTANTDLSDEGTGTINDDDTDSDLSIVKTVDNATPNVGENVVFTLTVTNNGPTDATGVSVTDHLPSGYTYVSDNGSGAYAGGIWTIGNLANGATVSLDITATVNATGDYANTATVSGDQNDPDNSDDSDTNTPTPNAVSDLSIVKTVDNSTPNVGDNVIFTLTVTNNGPSAATGVSVTDNLPSGYTYVSDNGSGAYAGGIWTIGNLANGATVSLDITATVNATGDYANTATVSGDQNDPDNSDDSDTNTPTPNAVSDLSIIKTVDNITPNVGDNVTFTIMVTNDGPNDATGVLVTDNLPSGYTYVSDNGNGAYNVETGIWTIGNLTNGETVSLQIEVTVNQSGNYVNTASITGNETDPDESSNEDSESSTPHTSADIVLTKTVDNSTPQELDNVTYTITVVNNGPANVTNLVITDELPEGLTFVSATPSVGEWTSPEWTIGTLNNGETATLQLVAKVEEGMSGQVITNTVSNTQDQLDDNNTPDDDDEEIEVDVTIFIPEGFSPNNDGINDNLVIKGIYNYPNNKIRIMNRWGNTVYEAQSYQNDWNGKNTMGLTIGGDDLPVGTYFYILELGEGNGVKKGYIYLNR